MKKLILHIGFNKTGSTSLQHNLFLNAKALERLGYCYPGAPSDSFMQNRQHTPLAAALPERNVNWLRPQKQTRLGHALPDLLDYLKHRDTPNIILSSEAFGGIDITEDHVSRIRERLAEFDIRVIAYIRRQDRYLMSTYQEGVKNGSRQSFQFKQFQKNNQLRFSRRLAPWRAVLGHEKVIVRPFDAKFWPKNELFFDFLHAIGAPYDRIRPSDQIANQSLDLHSVEVMRRINQILAEQYPDLLGPKLKALRVAALRGLRQIEAASGSAGTMQLSSQQAEVMQTYFYDDNCLSLEGSGISADDFFPLVREEREAQLVPKRLNENTLLYLLVLLAKQNHQI